MDKLLTLGMVISTMPIGEYDRRIELLTTDFGRISAFARGARKPNSPLVSVTRAFAFGTFELYQGRNSYTLNGAKITNYFDELSADMDGTCLGFYFLEAAQYFSRENVDGTEMLKLLYQALRAVSNKSLDNILVRAVYEIKILQLNGLCPPFERLAAAGGSYSFAAGMPSGTLKALEFVLSTPPEKLFTFRLGSDSLQAFSDIADRLMKQNTDRKFRSLDLIDNIKL